MANLVSNIDGVLEIWDDGTVNIVGGKLQIDSSDVLNNNNNALFSDVRVDTLDFGDASPTLSGSGDYLKIQTTHGFTTIGAGNTSYTHISTDRARFYFNTGLVVNSGIVHSYDEDLSLSRIGSTTARLRIADGTTHSDQDFSITGDATISGDLTVSGTTTTLNTTNTLVKDAVLTLNHGQTTPANDIGLLFQRYSSPTASNYNPVFMWEESTDRFVWGTTTELGADNDISLSAQWMTIEGTGDVGIGTTNPIHKLDVHGTGRFTNTLNIERSDGTFLQLKGTSNNTGYINWESNGFTFYTNGPSEAFRIGPSGIVVNEDSRDYDFRIETNGDANTLFVRGDTDHIGVGTNSPSVKLEVYDTTTWDTAHFSSSSTTGGGLSLDATDTNVRWSLIAQGTSGGANDNNLGFHLTNAGTSGSPTGYKMVMTHDGRFGIGDMTPLGKLHVKDGDAGSITTNGAHDTIIVEGDGNTGINIFSPDTSYQYLAFGDPGGSNRGYVRYQHSIDQMVLRAGGTDTVFINGGKVGIGTNAPTNAKVHIVGDGSYVGNYGYNTLTLEDTSGYPGLNLRTGNYNWLIRKSGSDNALQIVNSSNASGPGTGTYTNRFTISDGGNVGIGTNIPDTNLHVVGQGSFEHEGNRNRGNLILGPHGNGTSKWATLAGTHYNDATGSGNGSGAAGVMLIGSSTNSTTNKVFIGHGPYELNPATEIRLGTHTATTHTTGGSTHFVIDSDGKTIVGASSAQGIGASSKLQVRGGAIDITDSDSSRSIRFYQDTTFRGGIGPGNWTGEGSNSSLGMYATGGDISFHHNSGTPTVRISDEGHLGLERSDASSGVTKGYPKIVYPNVHWSGSGTTTGQVRIRLPGNLDNYDMLHMELTVYEYNSQNATNIIIGGHNWNSSGSNGSTNTLWHNYGVKVIGTFDKPIYLTGDANDRYIVLGDVGSSWNYGMVSLARVHGATFYSAAFDLAGDWNIEKVTSSSYTWSSSNLNTNTSDTLSTPGNIVTSGFKVGRGSNGNNFKVKTATTGAAGITLYNSDDTWRAQIYGDGTNYGFLNANWAAWDTKKVIGGKMFFNANDSYYLQPESISVFDELIVEGRRVNQSSNGLSMATGTWYTIATNPGSRASAKFHIRDTASSRHQSVHFYASHMYGNNSAITILHNCAYSTSPYRYIRIKEGSTYDGALLQVYTDSTASYVGYIYENDQSAGWNLLGTPVPDGTDPGTVSNFANLTNVPVQLDIDTTAYGGIATSGPIWSKYDVTAYSDRRVKTNIEVIPDALEKVKKLSGYTFNRTDTKHEVKQTGVIAQEVMEVLPEAVNGDDEGGYSVAYGNMAGILIEAIKEQQTQIEDLNDKVNTLEKLMKDILGK